MFYKVIYNGAIVDVLDGNDVAYIKLEPTSGMALRTIRGDPDIIGVLSSDFSTVYAIEDGTNYQKVELVESWNDEEYYSIKEELDAQREVIYEEENNEVVDISALKSVLAQQQAEQLMDLLQIITDDLSDELIVKYPAFVEKWEEGKSYGLGKRLSYNGDVYKVVKSIGTSGATPDNSAAYYTKLN